MLINPGASRLHAATIRIDDPGSLASFVGPGDNAFIHGKDGIVCLDEITRFECTSVCEANEWWADQVEHIDNDTELPGVFKTGPLALGSFLFDPDNSAHRSVMIVPRVIIGRHKGLCWLTEIGYDHVTPTLPKPSTPPPSPGEITFTSRKDESEWTSIVRAVVDQVQAGKASKVVLAREILAHSQYPIDPRWPWTWLVSAYGSCWNYMVDGLVGSTPEMLVRREDGMTISRVLAGTIQRIEGVDDRAQSSRLSSSEKDLEEHRMAVASVAETLGAHLSAIHIPEAPYVLTLPNVMHLATDITGISRPDYSTLQLAGLTHPSAAVCGTPTEVARQIIAEREGMDRGRYAGIVGWIDTQGDGEWGLALRCGYADPDDAHTMHLYAGGGIVSQSNPNAEFVETEAKLAPMKAALRHHGW